MLILFIEWPVAEAVAMDGASKKISSFHIP